MTRTLTLALLLTSFVLAACARNEAAPAPPAPPKVSVAKVLSQEITEFDEFNGRFEAVERVEVRPRVSGYIASIHFEQGHEVKKDDVLFVIDPRPYRAEHKRTQAELARARTQLALAQTESQRANTLFKARAVSAEEFDARKSASEQAVANVAAAEAAVESAALNLSFTQVRAPIAGMVGRAEITPGNVVASGETLLTTLVSIDPIYVAFDSDEQAYLKSVGIGRGNGGGTPYPVWVGLADETGHPHQGTMAFVDNELDPETGTIRARGVLENPERRYTPGMFARVKLTGSGEYQALLINDSAVATDQTVRYVLAVGKGNKVEYRPVQLGPKVDGLRVVREGLVASDVIVVNGLQSARPGDVVTPQLVAMGPRRAGDGLLARKDGKYTP